MIRYRAYSLIELGLWLRYLQRPERLQLSSVRNGIAAVIRALERVDFLVSRQAARTLIKFRDAIAARSDTEVLSPEEARDLGRRVRDLEKVITPEANTRYYFVVADQRYNARYLLEEPASLFRDGVYGRLPQLSQTDFSEGFRRLAFGRATAAAFHILRATEGELKAVYFRTVKKHRLKNPMWGPMLEQLRNRKRQPLPTVLAESLDMIRKSYRNPTSHPEAVYSIEEAEDLVGLCIDVVNKMDTFLSAA